MSAHAILTTAETALIWTVVSGVVGLLLAWLFARRPIRKIADQFDTSTPGGITAILNAIESAGPPPPNDTPTSTKR